MPELPSSVAEVHSHMAYRAQGLIFLRLQFGIEQPRLIGRGRAQYKFTVVLGAGQIVLLAELLQRHFLSQQIKCAVDPARCDALALQKGGGEHSPRMIAGFLIY